jgi:hypothetical protein
MSNRWTARQARRWGVGIGMAAGAAAMIGAGTAHADTPDDVIGQAIDDLNQGTSVLDTASTADLSAYQADVLSVQETLASNQDPGLTDLASLQDTLPAADQTSLATGVDEQLVSASQSILSADQAFVAADKAGDLSSSFLPIDWTIISADLDYLGADLNSGGATFLDILTGGLDASSAADLTSSLDPATAVDPSIFADILSSIGL